MIPAILSDKHLKVEVVLLIPFPVFVPAGAHTVLRTVFACPLYFITFSAFFSQFLRIYHAWSSTHSHAPLGSRFAALQGRAASPTLHFMGKVPAVRKHKILLGPYSRPTPIQRSKSALVTSSKLEQAIGPEKDLQPSRSQRVYSHTK